MKKEVIVKVDARRMSPDAQEDLRKRGMEMLKAGESQVAVARRLGVHRQCVVRWVKRMRTLPEEQAVKNDKRGPKTESSDKRRVLTAAQQRVVRAKIIDKNPKQYKFEFAMWTIKAIKALVKKLYQVELSSTTLRRYLKQWGMTVQRPAKRACKQDPDQVKQWLEQDYPAIARRAKAENAIIFWQDETGIHQDTNWVRGYAPKGQTPIIEHDASMERNCPSMLSVVSNQGKMHFRFHKGTVTAEVFLDFLKAIVEDYPDRKIFVIADNARIHHAKIVSAWLAENKDRIELFFLPPYTPEHNPDEYLNRQIKTHLRQKPQMNHEQALKVTESFLEKIRSFGGILVKKLFESPLVRYAADLADYGFPLLTYSK